MARLVGIALVALALGACGDDESGNAGGGDPQPSTVNKAQTAPDEAGTTSTTSTTEADDGAPASDGGEEQDSAEEQNSSQKAPSLAEYIRSADPICREAQSAIARRSAEYRKVGAALARRKIKAEEYYRRGGELTELSGEIAERAVADLKELELPRSRRDAVEAYLESATTHSAILTASGKALRQGRIKVVAKLNRRAAQASRETQRAARRVGFRVCGGGS